MSKTLTVFTPAYNRAHTLGRTYESLCRQTLQDFCWLIIDDGSTDGTKELVAQWMGENRIEMRYIYQENQGMHGAHNTAYANITTELNTCIDSDDYMPDDAVERIVKFWREKGDISFAGFVGYDIDTKGNVIGTTFPTDMVTTTLIDYYQRGGQGDKKLVYRTEVVKQYPNYPLFKGERYVGLNVLTMQIDADYRLLVLNEPLVIVDYQEDGSSRMMWKQYWDNPQGFLYTREINLRYSMPFKRRIRLCIHYVSHALRAKQLYRIVTSPAPWLTIPLLPIGICLFLYTWYKVKNNAKMEIRSESF
ncbi:MAG: glycosyltransferase family 2 protein [Alloprevotella sp.]|nr:glycosyltransferase family 2 protein [Alloprevotella sp.]